MTMTDYEKSEKPEVIYKNVNEECVDLGIKKKENQPPQNTGSVCLCLLCVLLLIIVIVLCVCYTNERKYIQNLTEEREQILNHNKNVTEERELVNRINDLTKEKEQILNHIDCLTEEREQILSHLYYLIIEKEKRMNDKTQLHCVPNAQDWLAEKFKVIYYNFSFYYISSGMKSWSDSRRYCQQRGADLAVVKGSEERLFLQTSVQNTSLWVGMREKERGVWKWINDPTVTNGFGSKSNSSNCMALETKGYYNFPCITTRGWICEKTYNEPLFNHSSCNKYGNTL